MHAPAATCSGSSGTTTGSPERSASTRWYASRLRSAAHEHDIAVGADAGLGQCVETVEQAAHDSLDRGACASTRASSPSAGRRTHPTLPAGSGCARRRSRARARRHPRPAAPRAPTHRGRRGRRPTSPRRRRSPSSRSTCTRGAGNGRSRRRTPPPHLTDRRPTSRSRRTRFPTYRARWRRRRAEGRERARPPCCRRCPPRRSRWNRIPACRRPALSARARAGAAWTSRRRCRRARAGRAGMPHARAEK